MSKTDDSKSFPSVKLILYTLLSYIYLYFVPKGPLLFPCHLPFIIICCVHIGYPRSAPISMESTICSLDLLRMLPTGSSQPASTLSFNFILYPSL
jgi:hypothetical protein